MTSSALRPHSFPRRAGALQDRWTGTVMVLRLRGAVAASARSRARVVRFAAALAVDRSSRRRVQPTGVAAPVARLRRPPMRHIPSSVLGSAEHKANPYPFYG